MKPGFERILFVNFRLAKATGTELYVRDLAKEFTRRDCAVAAFSPELGPLAEEIRGLTVPVSDDLSKMRTPPEVIHGQHHLPTMQALLAFPDAPAVYVCHGWRPWQEAPPVVPQIRRYIAVDTATRDRLVEECGVPAHKVRIVPNFVDLDRFEARWPLPEFPERAAIFSNYVTPKSPYYRAVAQACDRLGLALDVIGDGFDAETLEPHEVLKKYDVVFAQGRSALEAMAVGTAVMITSSRAFGPLVTPGNFDALRERNFGIRTLRHPVDADHVAAEIGKYDRVASAEVTVRVREQAGLEEAADEIAGIYQEAIEENRREPVDRDAQSKAISAYLGRVGERLAEVDGLRRRVARLEAGLQEARELSRDRGRTIRRMERTRAWRTREWFRKFRSRANKDG